MVLSYLFKPCAIVRWRTVAALFLFASFLTGCGTTGGTSADKQQVSDQPLTGPSATVTVYGMACPLCANNVDKQLLTLPGVETARVDMGKGVVLLTFKGQERPSPAQIETAVRSAGFTYKGVSTP